MSWMQKLLITVVLVYLVICPESHVVKLLCNWEPNGVSAHPYTDQGLILGEMTISRTMTRLFISSLMESNSNHNHYGRIQDYSGQNHRAAFKLLIQLLLIFRNALFPHLWLREDHCFSICPSSDHLLARTRHVLGQHLRRVCFPFSHMQGNKMDLGENYCYFCILLQLHLLPISKALCKTMDFPVH